MVVTTACSSNSSPASVSTPPSAPPTRAASPPPECPNPEGGSCLGRLSAGTYTTSVFNPTLTYRVPHGWGNFEDLSGNFLLLPPGGHLSGVDPGTSDYVGVYTSIEAESPDCGQAHVGASPAALGSYFSSNRELQTTTPRQVSIGGLDGVVL